MNRENRKIREEALEKCARIVLKVGTRLLTDIGRIGDIVSQIAFLKAGGCEVILVSSGAVGLGIKTLDLSKRPSKLSEIQALASIGQSKLMSLYEAECGKHGFHAAQLLLTADDIRDRGRHLNVLNCLNALLEKGILPIINENDAVSVEELKFGDNDTLAALIAVMLKANLTVILTTVDGLRKSQGTKALGERVSVVDSLDDSVRAFARGTDGNHFSIGGMASKLKAAEIIMRAGEYLIIADGRDSSVVEKIFACDDIGTLFVPKSGQMKSKKRWLGFFSRSKGRIFVDAGAERALCEKGRSLLPSGIKDADGDFGRGDTVDVCSVSGELLAKGLSNYSLCEIRRIAGRKSAEAKTMLGYDGDDEAVHRDNLALMKK